MDPAFRMRTVGALVYGCVLALAATGCRDQGESSEPAASEPGVPAESEEVPPSAPAPSAPEPAPAPPPAPAANIAVRDAGFKTPESVLYDADADVYLVSNINGSPTDADDNGFISRIRPDGSLEASKWIDAEKKGVTLDAPKGMAISGGILYVADIRVVRKFDAKTGDPKGQIAVKGATFLNDVAAGPDGAVYVSDTGVKATPKGFEGTGTDAVYKIVGDRAVPLIKNKDLGRPNGLFADATGLWVVTFGSGELYRVEGAKRAEVQKLPRGSLDGIVKTTKGLFLISSWEGEEVVQGGPGGVFSTVLAKAKAPADIGYDAKRNRLLVPLFMDDAVQIVGL